MENPIKNDFIQKAIKKDKTFCEQFRSNKFNNLSLKNISCASKIKTINHNNYDYSPLYKKIKKNNTLLKKKNFSELCILKPKQNIMQNSSFTHLNNLPNFIDEHNATILPRLIANNNKLDFSKIKKIHSNQNTLSNERNNANYLMNKKLEDLKSCMSSVLLTKNSDKINNSNLTDRASTKIKSFNNNQSKIVNYLYLNQKKNENYSHKKLLIKLNSLNSTLLNNTIWKIKNLKKLEKYRNKYENKYLSKRVMIKRIELENIT